MNRAKLDEMKLNQQLDQLQLNYKENPCDPITNKPLLKQSVVLPFHQDLSACHCNCQPKTEEPPKAKDKKEGTLN